MFEEAQKASRHVLPKGFAKVLGIKKLSVEIEASLLFLHVCLHFKVIVTWLKQMILMTICSISGNSMATAH